ncbi:hypothetical protein [Lactococcus lactis]|nr:hypothetical protein [Lactococcus lactis]
MTDWEYVVNKARTKKFGWLRGSRAEEIVLGFSQLAEITVEKNKTKT